MKKGKRRNDPTGFLDRGRHTFDRPYYEAIRAFWRVQIEQVQRSLGALNLALAKRPTPEMEGQREYWATVLAWLNGQYRRGQKSVDATDWEDAYTHVTTVERHAGSDATRKDQPPLPLM